MEMPRWKEALIRIVHSRGMDPWNLDLELLCEDYRRYIPEASLPETGGFVLAMAILLRLKSLMLEEEEEEETAITYEEEVISPPILRRRPITLEEVIFHVEKRLRKPKPKRRLDVPLQPPKLDGVDLEKIEQRIMEKIAGRSLVYFSDLQEGLDGFLAILDLEKEGRISTFQEKIMGDIIIRPL